MTIGADAIVIGAGAAGVAAAIALKKRNVGVRVLMAGAGATFLSGGTLDLAPWDQASHAAPAPIDERALSLLDALDLYRVTARGALVATTAGILRPARGIDRSLLDLSGLTRTNVLVPRTDHHAWDAVTLARSLADSPTARAKGLGFTAVDATVTRFRDERSLVSAELAARHDDTKRLGWLADRLRESLGRAGTVSAILLPPWLGIDRPRAEALSSLVGLPCGEAACALASACGLRFERARDRAFATLGIEARRAWVTAIESYEDEFVVAVEDGEPQRASAVILATGGLVGGGLSYQPSHAIHAGALPPEARTSFRLTIDVDGVLGAQGKPLELPGSLFGAAPEDMAWPYQDDPLMDRAGLLVSGDFAVKHAPSGLYACGDVVADRPRTWLEAWTSGALLAAGDAVPQKLVPHLEGEVLALRGVGR